MSTIKKLTKNIGLLTISYCLSYILGFIILAYSARYLGVENFGILSFALAFTSIFSVFIDLGINTLTTREVSRKKSLGNKFISNIIGMRLGLALLVLISIIIIINILNYNEKTIYVVYFTSIYMILSVFAQIFYSLFQSYEKMEYQALGNILYYIFLFIGVLIAINFNFNIIQFSMIYPIVSVLILIYVVIICIKKFTKPKLTFDFGFSKQLLNESWPFAITGISINIYNWIDTILLSIIIGQEAVGIYNAAYKLILWFIFIPAVFMLSVFPLMSRYYVSSENSLRYSFEKLVKIMAFIGIPIAFGTVLIANKVIIIIYGSQFISAVVPLQILIWSTVLIFIRNPYEKLLESSNKQFTVSKIFIIGIIFNIIANIIFIPKYSFFGAAIVNVITDLIIFILLIWSAKIINFSISNETKLSIIKMIIASILMSVVIQLVINLNIIIIITIGALTYLLIVYLLKVADKNEIEMIKSIFK